MESNTSSNRFKTALPSVVTLLGMSFGMVALILAALGDYRHALWFVVYAVLTDKLDGFVARRLDVASEFGMEMDSLADVVSFGIAPAVIFVVLSFRHFNVEPFKPLGLFVLFAAFIYAWMAAIRLAKFNITTHNVPGYFVGIASTFAAALVSTMGLVALKYNAALWYVPGAAAVYILAALLMVSRILTPKLAMPESAVKRYLMLILVPAVYVCGFSMRCPEFLFGLSVLYLLGGLLNPRKEAQDGTKG